MKLKIDNGTENAITEGKWSRDRGKELYRAIANADNRLELGREGFLIFSDDAFKLWPRASGLDRCKYPHHQVVDGNLVISIPGMRAAYARAKQQKVYEGELKAHLDRHFVELGLAHYKGDELIMEDAQLITEATIADNFDEIEAFMEKRISGGQIRPLADKDLDGLLPWLLKFDEFNGPFNPDGSDFNRNLLIDDPASENYAYGYFIGDKVVGFVRGYRRGNDNHITHSFLFVRPDHQGQGIGKELFRFMVMKFDRYEQRLNVPVDNLRAIRLYRKYGFYTVDQQAHPCDRNVPDQICYKFLKPASITSDDYDPPLDYSRLPEHLRQDEIHLWRADTGLELIHREPSQAELDRIWHNWERMTDRQKTISDKVSRKFFGRSNSRHLADLRAEASNSESYRESSEPSDDDTGKPDVTAEADEPTTTANEEPEKSKIPEKESMPKQVDRAEAPKNGVKRKELYIAFIEYAKRINSKNTFGSVFDKDAFKVTYPFVPEEMRYFYRLANPLLCILENGQVFFSLAELRKVNTDNPAPDRWMIFAADRKAEVEQIIYAFNRKDKAIYCLDETSMKANEPIGEPTDESKVGKLADSFDTYLERLAGVKIL